MAVTINPIIHLYLTDASGHLQTQKVKKQKALELIHILGKLKA